MISLDEETIIERKLPSAQPFGETNYQTLLRERQGNFLCF